MRLSSKHQWLAAIVGLLLANIIAMVILIVYANIDGSQVLPEYKGVTEKR